MPFLFSVAAFFAVVVGSFVLPAVLMLLLPGRKGSMRTRRQAVHSGTTAAGAFDAYAARLAHDGFAIDAGGYPDVLRARRGKMFDFPDDIPTHATKPTTVEVRFSASPVRRGEVAVEAEAWLNDFVFFDSGEGRQVDETLYRLLAGDLVNDPPPAVATPSYHAVVAFTAAAMCCAGAWLLPRMIADDVRAIAAAAGLILGTVAAAFPEVRAALRDVAMRPGEVTGAALARVAAVVAVVGIVLNVLVIWRLAAGA